MKASSRHFGYPIRYSGFSDLLSKMMNMKNMTTADGDDANSMSSTFSTWSTYKLHLLFVSWNITTAWQFALTFFAVVFAVIFYHFLECATGCFEKGMITYLNQSQFEDIVANKSNFREDDVPTVAAVPVRPRGWMTVKIIYSVICAIKYALALFLMLVAMTMNPSLFLALFVGYLLGDFIFCDYKLNSAMGYTKPLKDFGGAVRTLIEIALCKAGTRNVDPVDYAASASTVASQHSTRHGVIALATNLLWILPRVTSLVFLVVLLVWIVQVQGGLGWDAESVFGWHPLLMAFFVTLFTNEAILTYKAPLLPLLTNHRTFLK